MFATAHLDERLQEWAGVVGIDVEGGRGGPLTASEQLWQTLCHEVVGRDAVPEDTSLDLFETKLDLAEDRLLATLARTQGEDARLDAQANLKGGGTTLNTIMSQVERDVGQVIWEDWMVELRQSVEDVAARNANEEEKDKTPTLEALGAGRPPTLIERLDKVCAAITVLEAIALRLLPPPKEKETERARKVPNPPQPLLLPLWSCHDALLLGWENESLSREPTLALSLYKMYALCCGSLRIKCLGEELAIDAAERAQLAPGAQTTWDRLERLIEAFGIRPDCMFHFDAIARHVAKKLGTSALDSACSRTAQLELLERKVADLVAVRRQLIDTVGLQHLQLTREDMTWPQVEGCVAAFLGGGSVPKSTSDTWRGFVAISGTKLDDGRALLDPAW